MLHAFKICSSDWSWEPNVGGGGNSGVTKPNDIAIEDKIDDSELNGKAKCLNDLLNKKGDSFVKKLLANFEGKSEFDIKIVSQEKVFSTATKLEVNGSTTSPVGKTMLIKINSSRIKDLSALETARIILHEYIHADIYRKTLGLNNSSNDGADFKETLKAYSNQHGAFADLYINSMTNALKSFHKEVLTEDYHNYIKYYDEEPSDDFYKAFSWGGLQDADVIGWTAKSELEKNNITKLAKRQVVLSKISPCDKKNQD